MTSILEHTLKQLAALDSPSIVGRGPQDAIHLRETLEALKDLEQHAVENAVAWAPGSGPGHPIWTRVSAILAKHGIT